MYNECSHQNPVMFYLKEWVPIWKKKKKKNCRKYAQWHWFRQTWRCKMDELSQYIAYNTDVTQHRCNVFIKIWLVTIDLREYRFLIDSLLLIDVIFVDCLFIHFVPLLPCHRSNRFMKQLQSSFVIFRLPNRWVGYINGLQWFFIDSYKQVEVNKLSEA